MNFLKKIKFYSFLNSALLVAILGILIQQYFFKSNKQIEGRIDLRKEMLKTNYDLYNKLNFWSEINTQFSATIINGDSISQWQKGSDDLIVHLDSNHSATIKLEGAAVIRLILDTNLQKLSNQYTDEIYNAKFNIDPAIFDEFTNILNYKKQMELKNDSVLSNLIKLGWADGPAYNKWINLNIEFRHNLKAFANFE